MFRQLFIIKAKHPLASASQILLKIAFIGETVQFVKIKWEKKCFVIWKSLIYENKGSC